MKSVIFVLVVNLYFSSAVDHDSLLNWVQKCRAETGFDNKNYDELKDLIKDPDSKKLFLCVAKAGNMLREDGVMDGDVIKQVLPDEKEGELRTDEEAMVDGCIVQRSTPEDTVFDTFICIEKRIYFRRYGKPLDI